MSAIRMLRQVAFTASLAYTHGMQQAPEQPHSKYPHVYPIVRIDAPIDLTNPTQSITVVKVLTSLSDAEAEVSRLTQVNTDKSCLYFYRTSRLIEQGR